MTRLLFFALAGVVLGGCALTPREPQPVRHYELTATAPPHARTRIDRSIRIGRFRALGGIDLRFVYRQGDSEVALDDTNRWAAPPEQLVAREFYRGLLASERFATVLPTVRGDADIEVNGDILALEATPDGQALLEMAVRLEDARTSRVLMIERHRLHQRLEERTPEVLADTLGALLGEVIAATADQLATIELPTE